MELMTRSLSESALKEFFIGDISKKALKRFQTYYSSFGIFFVSVITLFLFLYFKSELSLNMTGLWLLIISFLGICVGPMTVTNIYLLSKKSSKMLKSKNLNKIHLNKNQILHLWIYVLFPLIILISKYIGIMYTINQTSECTSLFDCKLLIDEFWAFYSNIKVIVDSPNGVNPLEFAEKFEAVKEM